MGVEQGINPNNELNWATAPTLIANSRDGQVFNIGGENPTISGTVFAHRLISTVDFTTSKEVPAGMYRRVGVSGQNIKYKEKGFVKTGWQEVLIIENTSNFSRYAFTLITY